MSARLGDTVSWDNTGSFTHSSSGDAPLSLWSIDLPAGDAKARPFKQAGTFPYHCRFHPAMVGTVKVPLQVSDATPPVGQQVTLRVATIAAPAGFNYSLQHKAPGGSFRPWKTITGKTTHFKSATAGTWRFRARLVHTADGATSGWSPTLSVHVHA